MEHSGGVGKLLIIFGGIIIVAGLVIIFFGKIPFLGKLPGDFSIKGKNWSFYFPFATSIILSIVISLILYLAGKFFR